MVQQKLLNRSLPSIFFLGSLNGQRSFSTINKDKIRASQCFDSLRCTQMIAEKLAWVEFCNMFKSTLWWFISWSFPSTYLSLMMNVWLLEPSYNDKKKKKKQQNHNKNRHFTSTRSQGSRKVMPAKPNIKQVEQYFDWSSLKSTTWPIPRLLAVVISAVYIGERKKKKGKRRDKWLPMHWKTSLSLGCRGPRNHWKWKKWQVKVCTKCVFYTDITTHHSSYRGSLRDTLVCMFWDLCLNGCQLWQLQIPLAEADSLEGHHPPLPFFLIHMFRWL